MKANGHFDHPDNRLVWRIRKGTASLLLMALTVPLVLVLTTSLAITRQKTDEAGLVRAMRAQLQVSLADYDPDLLNQFGLFGVNPERLQTKVFDELLPRRYVGATVQIRQLESVFNPSILSAEISRNMKLRLPMLWIYNLAGTSQIEHVDDKPELMLEPGMTQAVELLDGPLEPLLDLVQSKLIEALLFGLEKVVEPEIKEKLNGLMTSVDEIGDLRSTLNGMDHLGDIVSAIGKTLDSVSAGTESKFIKQAEIAEYCLAYMTRTVTERKQAGQTQAPAQAQSQAPLQAQAIRTINGQCLSDLAEKRPAEVEQILTGAQSPESAVSQVRSLIIFVRSLVNLADVLTDSGLMADLRVQAVSIVAAISLASGAAINIDPELLANLLAVGTAIKQGIQDYTALSSGQAVPLLPERLAKLPFEFAYQDYLRLFLLIVPQEDLVSRIGGLIQRSMGRDYGQAVEMIVMIEQENLAVKTEQRKVHLVMAYDT